MIDDGPAFTNNTLQTRDRTWQVANPLVRVRSCQCASELSGMSFGTTGPFGFYSHHPGSVNWVSGAEGAGAQHPGAWLGLPQSMIIQEPGAREAQSEDKGEGISSLLKPLLRVKLVLKPNVLVPR